MVNWPQNLISDLARRRVVLVIGSGVSRHSVGEGGLRPPTWKEFLTTSLGTCPDSKDIAPVEDAIGSGDFLHACEWLKKRYDEDWIDHLRTIFMTPGYKPAKIHESILRLDSRIVFSLNFDNIYERHVNNIHNHAYVLKNYYDADVSEFLRKNSHFIVKVHGNLDSPGKLIFTQNEYSQARIKNATFYHAFDAALITHTFLFIGCGYNDPDINLILENQNFGFPHQPPHYLLTGTQINSDRKLSLRKNRNIKVIEYDPVDDNHSGLIAELDKLGQIVEEERFSIVKSGGW